MKQQAEQKICEWDKVVVDVLNRNTGDLISREIQTPSEVIEWHQDSDVDVRMFSGGLICQVASAGVERRLRNAAALNTENYRSEETDNGYFLYPPEEAGPIASTIPKPDVSLHDWTKQKISGLREQGLFE
jgi:hypothetical protein